jgi:membrane fusion protein (multidrug efflux system)
VARLSSPAEGPVEGLSVREGDHVAQGQILLKIGRTRGVKGRVAANREDLRKALDELARVERLVQKGAVPGEWLDRAQADLARARSDTAVVEESLSDYQLRAPWDGIVSVVPVQDGNYVSPRALLVEIFDPASLVVRVSLPEAAAAGVPEGTVGKATIDAFPGREFQATVTRIYPELDRRLRTRVAEFVVDDPPQLAPGMFARVTLPVQTATDVVTIPRTAVVPGVDGTHAVFVVQDGKALRRNIEIGVETPDIVQVRSGLQADENVIVAGLARVHDGLPVRIQGNAAAPEAAR